MMRRLVSALMRYELRRSFRRICWVGDWPTLPPETPLVIYANHHHFYDGHLLWWLITQTLDRPGTTWMADWDRFPFFAAAGAQPFPPQAPARRRATLRRTARLFREQPDTILAYFPAGRLHPPEDGIASFDAHHLEQLGRLFPDAQWWPLAIHVTWWGDAFPTALLTGDRVHPHPPQNGRSQLEQHWNSLRRERPPSVETLFEGRRSPSDHWSFAFARSFFERYLSPDR
jgi:1-acyl-sn-glycerol-3-phosphate acyltransferase